MESAFRQVERVQALVAGLSGFVLPFAKVAVLLALTLHHLADEALRPALGTREDLALSLLRARRPLRLASSSSA